MSHPEPKIKIVIADSTTRKWINYIRLPGVPSVGHIVDCDGLYQVELVVWHYSAHEAATLYCRKLDGMPKP